MMGHAHALSGMAIGAVSAPFVVHDTVGWVAWTVAVGGFALLPDLDSPTTTVARMWGPVSWVVAKGVGKAAGGHRRGTHDPVVGPVVFGLVAWLASLLGWGQIAALAVACGLALCALSAAIPGKQPWDWWPVNLVISWTAGWLLVTHRHAGPWWLPFAVALGVLAHDAGDEITKQAIPKPFSWIGGHPKYMAFSPVHASSKLLNGTASVLSLAVVGWFAMVQAGADPATIIGGS